MSSKPAQLPRPEGPSGPSAPARPGGTAGVAAGPILVLVFALGGCGGISDAVPDATSPAGQFLRGTSAAPTTLNPADFRVRGPCPRVEILPETETVRATTGGTEFEEGELRYQARLERTARECNPGPTGTTVKVGLAGRALSGPGEPPGQIRLPIRIAVREGEAVVYSKIHPVSVTLTAGAPSVPWAIVVEDIVVQDPATAEILVGFDPG